MDKVVPMSKIAGIHNGSMNIKITNYMAGQPPRMGHLVRPFLFLVKVDCTDTTFLWDCPGDACTWRTPRLVGAGECR